MKEWKKRLVDWKFVITVLIGIGIANWFVRYLFSILGLPEVASVSDNLTQTQVVAGFILSLVQLVLSVADVLFKILFVVSIFLFLKGRKGLNRKDHKKRK